METLFRDFSHFHVISSKSVCALSDNGAPNEKASWNCTPERKNILDQLGETEDEILSQHIET